MTLLTRDLPELIADRKRLLRGTTEMEDPARRFSAVVSGAEASSPAASPALGPETFSPASGGTALSSRTDGGERPDLLPASGMADLSSQESGSATVSSPAASSPGSETAAPSPASGPETPTPASGSAVPSPSPFLVSGPAETLSALVSPVTVPMDSSCIRDEGAEPVLCRGFLLWGTTPLTEDSAWKPSLAGFGIRDASGCRRELFGCLERAGRLESMLYESLPDLAEQYEEWRGLTDESWTLALTMPGEGGQRELAAVVLLTLFSGRSAVFHFCLFPGWEGLWTELGRNVLDWLFWTGMFTSFIGVTPGCYRHVLRGLPRFGFDVRCAVPEGCFIRRRRRYCDMILSVCTRTSFMEAGR